MTRALDSPDKHKTYNGIYQESGYKRARPLIYFLPLLTPTGRLAKMGTNGQFLDVAERTLIEFGRAVNEDIWNVKHRAFMGSFEIDGVHNSKLRAGSAKGLKGIFSTQ